MKITEILKPEFVIADLKSENKEEALEELSSFLEQKGAIKNKEKLKKALMDREKLGSTGIGENVAIPHAKCEETFRRSSPSSDGPPKEFILSHWTKNPSISSAFF